MISTLLSLLFSGSMLLGALPFLSSNINTDNSNLPVEDIVIMASPSKKGAVLIKECSGKLSDDLVMVEIYNLKGKKVKELKLEKVDGLFEIQVDTLREGEYVLQFETNKNKFQSRLIITD